MLHPLAFQIPSMGEWIVIAAIGLLFFGKRLPEVGRSLGKGIVEFKKGLKGIEDDIDEGVNEPAKPVTRVLPAQKYDPYTGKEIQSPSPKFDPYTGKPIETQVAEHAPENETVPPQS